MARNHQLDGWRALSVLGVMWHHWAPASWRGPFPFEIGLYFFLTLTGFLITRILLRERDRGEKEGQPWKARAFRRFQLRRSLRILIPCYAAMLFGLLVGAPDLRAHPLPYFAQVSNFHLAVLPEWPAGTAHYWTLALQQQFYLVWPLVVFLAPKRWLAPLFAALFLVAPLSRFVLLHHFLQVVHPGAITTSALDYLSGGALLALLLHRGLAPGDRRLRIAGWIGLLLWLGLYATERLDAQLPGLRHFQQSFLTLAMLGLIGASLHGFRPGLARFLESSPLQHFARLSYSLYLLHAAVPLGLGWIAAPLWHPGVPEIVRIVAFFLASCGLAWLSWRFVEKPTDRLRDRLTST